MEEQHKLSGIAKAHVVGAVINILLLLPIIGIIALYTAMGSDGSYNWTEKQREAYENTSSIIMLLIIAYWTTGTIGQLIVALNIDSNDKPKLVQFFVALELFLIPVGSFLAICTWTMAEQKQLKLGDDDNHLDPN